MGKEKHKNIHKDLHRNLDILLADFITNTGKFPSKTTILEFLRWSNQQTINPTDPK